MDSEHYSPLLEQIRHYNLDYLIPLHLSTNEDDEEEDDDFGYDSYDPRNDEYYEDQFDEDDELLRQDDDDIECVVQDMDDFCVLFGLEYLEPPEVLAMNLWDLFGVSKKQFDLIDWDQIKPEDFTAFYDAFTEEKRDLSVEKKILYATAEASTNYRSAAYRGSHGDTEKLIAYLERIIDTHTLYETQDIIKLLSDYWRFYDDALEMNTRREAAGEPTFKYVMTPKPAHIADLHHKAFLDHMTLETERKSENRIQINAEIKQVSQMHQYRSFLYTGAKFSVNPVSSQDDLDYEGEYLHHCVASYGSYMARADSFIYFIRKTDNLDTPFFTAEILPPRKEGDKYVLNQLYTHKDTVNKSQDLRDFILEWAKEKKFTIRCEF